MGRAAGLAVLVLLASAGVAAAEDAGASQAGYSLLRPVPPDRMREPNPDRPDKTESPYTVDAGHFQLEMDVVRFTWDDTDGVRTETWNAVPFNLKAGVLPNVDVQLLYDAWVHVRTTARGSGAVERRSGGGDLTARVKWNVWGDDGGTTAFALLPFVKFPTATGGVGNGVVEGGVILPLAVQLPRRFDMGLETEVAALRSDADGDYEADVTNSVTVGHRLVGTLGGYVEFSSEVPTRHAADWIGTADTGLVLWLSANLEVDCGCNFGVTPAADDYNPFAGLTRRF